MRQRSSASLIKGMNIIFLMQPVHIHGVDGFFCLFVSVGAQPDLALPSQRLDFSSTNSACCNSREFARKYNV